MKFKLSWKNYFSIFNGIIIFLVTVLNLCIFFYPSMLSLEGGKVDLKRYEHIKHKLSPNAQSFIKGTLEENFTDPTDFFKSIPNSLTHEDLLYIYDIFEYSYANTSIHVAIISITLLITIVFIGYREWSGSKKYAIAHSLLFLHKAIHHFRDNWDLIFQIHSGGQKQYNNIAGKKCLTESLNEVALYFTAVSGTPCRACIKVITNAKENCDQNKFLLSVKTFARNSGSKQTIPDDSRRDTIENNSEFLEILESQKAYCYYRNIDNVPNYYNSHLDPKKTGKKKSHQLGYKSTLTFAINKKTCIDTDNIDSEVSLYGFLCIDTQVQNVFSERFDIQAGYLLADYYSLFLKKILAFS